MKVLILSKTHMSNDKCCVGGITHDGQPVRLLTSQGENQPENTDFKPKQIWEIEFTQRSHIEAPHTEDVLVNSRNFVKDLKDKTVLEVIKEMKMPIREGSPDVLFDGKLKWNNTDMGSFGNDDLFSDLLRATLISSGGHINKESIPEHSVEFWISDKDLISGKYINDRGETKHRYSYNERHRFSLPYVGFETPVEKIPAGTLLRVSLSRWWQKKPGYYLQLSGWYDLV